MSVALRRQQKLAIILLVILTLLVITFTLLSTMAHINLWHILQSWAHPSYQYPYY